MQQSTSHSCAGIDFEDVATSNVNTELQLQKKRKSHYSVPIIQPPFKRFAAGHDQAQASHETGAKDIEEAASVFPLLPCPSGARQYPDISGSNLRLASSHNLQ